ncbi:hypothetical protein [Tanticharoenia sakaeratensis]|uniref:Uncharacterized protein n=1 Tax=Tanticharoenia sakaeratensis NBRC 103193 TaxID=1231623 RepID=A0A0D6MIQ2_9PROT|nr:hypothetical protein [Tanticharoenia sakaeratensis]GAN53325.1 hypothetical protein Tasa_009_120 [Tanticharoenia sakaeratensis NBRC 103193]GBQ20968.1 hypothetical protein AA103193_1567 [Tanticharoenia sakaeratensis NBRC 103193]
MYDLIDRPVRDLPPFERTVLLATRRWTHALSLAGSAPLHIGGSAFSDVMTRLHDASRMTLVIRAPCHDAVDDAEAIIVNLWRLVRDGHTMQARRIAADLIGDASDGMLRAIRRAIPAL